MSNQGNELQERAVTHRGDRKMVSSEEVAGAESLIAHSLIRESWDASVLLTSIFTCPAVTGGAPSDVEGSLKAVRLINNEHD